MFVSHETICDIADDMQSSFEFSLHSQSSMNEIARVAREHLQERGLPTRASLCRVIAQVARVQWLASCSTVQRLNSQ